VDGAAAEKKAPEPEPTLLMNPARVKPASSSSWRRAGEGRAVRVRSPAGPEAHRGRGAGLVLTDAPSTAAANNAPTPSAREQAAMAVDEEPQLAPAFEYTS